MSSPFTDTDAVLDADARAAFDAAVHLDWRSHDPFDLLLSPYLGFLRRRAPFLARVAVQIGRQSGTRVRRAFRVPTHTEPKALADYLRAAVLLSSTGHVWAAQWIEPLVAKLSAEGVSAEGTQGWGLAFPYASRFTNAAAGRPNIYVTTAAAEALLDAAGVAGNSNAAETAHAGSRFVIDGLGTFTRQGRQWLRYWADNDARIINVQASAASLLARAGRRFSDARLLSVADEAVETVLAAQRTDGSWPYSEEPTGAFVDGFHTGFTLQGLTEYDRSRSDSLDTSAVRTAIRLGLDYFLARLMAREGLPLGFADGCISRDPQNVAQCVQTLVVCAGDRRDVSAALRVWMLAMDADGTNHSRSTSAPFAALRWSLGPRVLATAHLLRAVTEPRRPLT